MHTQSYIRNKLLASKLVLSYPLFGGNLSVGGEYTDTRRNDEYRNPEKYVESTISRVEEDGLSGFAEYSRQFPIGNLSLGVRYEHVTLIIIRMVCTWMNRAVCMETGFLIFLFKKTRFCPDTVELYC